MRRLVFVGVLLLVPGLTGCLLEARLRSNGSGTLRLQYHVGENATLGSIAQQLGSPSVVVRSGRIDRQGRATFKVDFKDVSTISTAQMLKNLSVARTAGVKPGTTDITAKIVQPKPIHLPEKVLQRYGNALKVTITFPGPLVVTNATSHTGPTATWVFDLRAVTSAPETLLTATYTNPDGASGG
jgi:hypothetical protein